MIKEKNEHGIYYFSNNWYSILKDSEDEYSFYAKTDESDEFNHWHVKDDPGLSVSHCLEDLKELRDLLTEIIEENE